MIRWFLIICAGLVVVTVSLLGFRGQKFTQPPLEIFPDMDRQAKVKSQKPSEFFADGKGDRLAVAGTVPMGYTIPDAPRQDNPSAISEKALWSDAPYGFSTGAGYYDTGKMGGVWGDGIPIAVDAALIARGKDRFGIYCAVCHGAAGDGKGVVANYQGMKGVVANLHQDRLRQMPDGQIYNTIAYGKGIMYGYGDVLPVNDRWAIVAYLRLLQKSHGIPAASLTEEQRALIQDPPAPGGQPSASAAN